MIRKAWDLLTVSVLAIIAIGIVVAGLSHYRWLAAPGVLLALVLPGYALSAALLPDLESAERLLCTFGLSLVINVLGGLVLHMTPAGLHPISWALWLGGLTLVASGIAWLQRRALPAYTLPGWTRFNGKMVVGLGLVLAISAAAFVTAESSARQKDLPFTQLWAVPENTAEPYALHIGIHNQENKLEHYRLSVESNGDPIEEWSRLELQPNEEWTARLTFPNGPTQTVRLLLYRLDQPAQVYRMIQISPASFAMP